MIGSGKVSRRKVAVLLDFVQMRGGGRALPKSFVRFSHTVYIGSIWGWEFEREGETPAQIFWHIAVKKKWHKLSKLGGGGTVDKKGGVGNHTLSHLRSRYC